MTAPGNGHHHTGALPRTRDAAAARATSHDPSRHWRTLPVALTLAATLLALILGWSAWKAWIATPWTRDGRVRVYVVSIAPEVAGRVVELRVRDNQFVHKGDLLMLIDPADYAIAVSSTAAELAQAEADLENKQTQARRRLELTTLSTSVEEKQTYATQAAMAQAAMDRMRSQLAQAKVNLRRTEMRSPVNGWVTNLLVQEGDFASVGQRNIAVIDSDSFWLDGYFEEDALARINDGDPVRIQLMGYTPELRGHVESVARGIQVANAQPDAAGLASVNPVFTWVRLAQRVPVRIRLDAVPPGVRLVAGMTATVRVEVGGRHDLDGSQPPGDPGQTGGNAEPDRHPSP